MEQEFHKIRRLPPYVFAEVNQLKADARAEGRDIVDFGMGNPDAPPPQHVIDKLTEAAQNPRAHRYSTSKGIAGLRKALAGYYARRFNVDLDPDREALVTLGSKEGLANLAQAITSPGDVLLVPNPSYPIHAFGFIIAGAALRSLPLAEFDDDEGEFRRAFMCEMERAVRHSVPRPLAVVLNYPANPTTRTVDLDFYGEVVEFCRHHGVYIISDIAYSEVYFDGTPPPSVLEIPGAKEIAVEFSSLSKTYSMPGWRVGFCAGNPKLISALARVKSYLDYGAFTPVQVAATAALNGPQDCVEEMRARYRSRRDVLIRGLNAAGWPVESPTASMFVWAPVPPAFRHLGSLAFSKLLLEQAEVAVSPGVGFGEYGDNHVRLALVENEHRTRQAIRNIKAFFRKADIPDNVADITNKDRKVAL